MLSTRFPDARQLWHYVGYAESALSDSQLLPPSLMPRPVSSRLFSHPRWHTRPRTISSLTRGHAGAAAGCRLSSIDGCG